MELDRAAVLVQEAMVERAERDRVLEAGVSAVGPVHDVVGLEVEAVRAAGKPARSIALQERPLHRARDRAPLAADGERRAVLVLDDLDHAAIAAQAASRLRRDAGAVREARHVAWIRDLRG